MGFNSVTLIPNIFPKIKIGNSYHEINLVDMAGYSDTGRSYVGVFGVSYMLKRTQEKVKKAKYLLVLDHASMSHSQLDTITKYF